MKPRVVAAAAVLVSLVAAGCTDDGEPTNVGTPGASASSSMTFDEAYRQVPMNGTGALKIVWEVPRGVDVAEVLAARRSLAFDYWQSQATDWTPIVPIGRYLYTEWFYQQTLAGFEKSSGSDDPLIGTVWVKFMGVEKSGPDLARVTFCTDVGWWLQTSWNKTTPRKDRAQLESLVMINEPDADGERHWLANPPFSLDGDWKEKHGAECTKWAQHQP